MIPAPFDYAAPGTLEEALDLLQANDEARVLAGGQSLIPLLRLRLARPGLVVDLRRIAPLRAIVREGDVLTIGSCVTHDQVLTSGVIREAAPLLSECAGRIGDVQVRNAGTIGGSVVHADPAGDWPAALLATGATLVLRDASGERRLPVESFLTGPLESDTRPGEILTAIEVPVLPAGHRSRYMKIAQSASGFAICGVAVVLQPDGGAVRQAHVGITGVAEVPYRARKVEEALKGRTPDEAMARAAFASAADGVELVEDIHASARYRRHLASVLTRRAVLAAWGDRP